MWCVGVGGKVDEDARDDRRVAQGSEPVVVSGTDLLIARHHEPDARRRQTLHHRRQKLESKSYNFIKNVILELRVLVPKACHLHSLRVGLRVLFD